MSRRSRITSSKYLLSISLIPSYLFHSFTLYPFTRFLPHSFPASTSFLDDSLSWFFVLYPSRNSMLNWIYSVNRRRAVDNARRFRDSTTIVRLVPFTTFGYTRHYIRMYSDRYKHTNRWGKIRDAWWKTDESKINKIKSRILYGTHAVRINRLCTVGGSTSVHVLLAQDEILKLHRMDSMHYSLFCFFSLFIIYIVYLALLAYLYCYSSCMKPYQCKMQIM